MRRQTKPEQYQYSSEVKRVIPLGGGEYCYISDENGKSKHYKRGSDEYINEIMRLDPIMNGKITKELEDLGWV